MKSKGVTPVIATVLLIGISVSATVFYMGFVTQMQDDVTGNQEDRLQKQDRIDNSDLTIESAYNSTNGFITLVVRNTGSYSIELEESENKLMKLYVDGRPVDWKYKDNSDPSNFVLDPNQVVSINTTTKFPARDNERILKIAGPYQTTDAHTCYNSGRPTC